MTLPPTSPLLQLIEPGCTRAVVVAIHDVDPSKFHRERLGPEQQCEFCPTELQQSIEDKIDELMGDTELAPWQRKLASEVLAAKLAPNEVPISEALQTYLDDRSLVADPGEIDDDVDD